MSGRVGVIRLASQVLEEHVDRVGDELGPILEGNNQGLERGAVDQPEQLGGRRDGVTGQIEITGLVQRLQFTGEPGTKVGIQTRRLGGQVWMDGRCRSEGEPYPRSLVAVGIERQPQPDRLPQPVGRRIVGQIIQSGQELVTDIAECGPDEFILAVELVLHLRQRGSCCRGHAAHTESGQPVCGDHGQRGVEQMRTPTRPKFDCRRHRG